MGHRERHHAEERQVERAARHARPDISSNDLRRLNEPGSLEAGRPDESRQRPLDSAGGVSTEEGQMSGLDVRSVSSPEEVRPFQDGKGTAAVVHVAGQPVLYATFEPGWRWSQHVKPIAGTDSCQTNHFGYVLSGRMHIVMNDGAESEVGPGDV